MPILGAAVEGDPFNEAPVKPEPAQSMLGPAIEGDPFAEREPLPQAYQDRLAAGAAVSDGLQAHSQRGVIDKLLGLTGPRYQLWPETLARSAFTLPHDVMTGDVLTGPGLRKEDFSDDPSAPDPLSTLIARTQDLAAFALPSTAFDRPPLVSTQTGEAVRLVSDADGTMRGQVIGYTPTPQDFAVAAKQIGGPESFDNLQTFWNDHGVHPAEVANDVAHDAWFKHDVATNPDRGVRSDLAMTTNPMINGIIKDPKTKEAIDHFEVNRDNDVPYSAGPDKTGNGLNIDRNFPHQMTVDGVTFDPAEPLAVHEFVERDTMNKLTKGGMSDDAAYRVAHYEFATKAENEWYKVHGLDPAAVEEAYRPFIDAIDHENPNNPPPDLFKKPYPHSNVTAAGQGPVEVTPPSTEEIAHAHRILDKDVATTLLPKSLGAAATDAPLLSPKEQPLERPGELTTLAQAGINKFNEISQDVKMLTSPMVAGSRDTMAIVKDTANAQRKSRWEWARQDEDLVNRFTPEQRKRMWDASDEESVLQQEGKTSEHMGLATLEPEEREAIERLQAASQVAFGKAKDLGMIETEGLPSYTPRVSLNMMENLRTNKPVALNAKRGIRVSSTSLMERKYLTAEETEAAAKEALGPSAQIVRDIRVLPFKTAELENAVIGRTLINNIEEYGARTGTATVIKGNLPAGVDAKNWFTVESPAFNTWRPMMERDTKGNLELPMRTVKNEDGDTMFERVPIYVHKDFEGPLRSIMQEKSGALYRGMMAVKGKTMGLIMNSPMIHNIVEWSRALPAMPMKVLTLRAYFEGNAVKNNPAIMHEFIDNGLVPIGKRFFNQDITSIAETPNLSPGRSWTAQVLAFVPGLFDEGAETAVKQAVDKAGNFWHNTLLWDRVADLQMGIAVNLQRDMISKGFDRVTATRYAMHFANRFAGSLPQEAMSTGARKLANLLMFSRTYTLGNIGVMKDAVLGLPQDISAQIYRDAGPEVLSRIKSKARRMATSTVALDIGLSIIGGSILQNVFNVINNDSSWANEFRGYVKRLQGMEQDIKQHPLSLLLPWNAISEAKKISATAENEPGKENRIHIGTAADGTGIYASNPMGRMGNEFMDYMTGPLDQMKRKLGTFAKPVYSILANDRGFGRKVYDPNALENGTELQAAMNIAKTVMESQAPTGQITAFGKLVASEQDRPVAALQLFGPVLGTNISKGAPGGPKIGDYYHAKEMQQFQIEQQTSDIRDLIKTGNIVEAQRRMTALGMNKGYQRWMLKTTLNPALRFNPKTAKEMYQFLAPNQRERLMNTGGQ